MSKGQERFADELPLWGRQGGLRGCINTPAVIMVHLAPASRWPRRVSAQPSHWGPLRDLGKPAAEPHQLRSSLRLLATRSSPGGRAAAATGAKHGAVGCGCDVARGGAHVGRPRGREPRRNHRQSLCAGEGRRLSSGGPAELPTRPRLCLNGAASCTPEIQSDVSGRYANLEVTVGRVTFGFGLMMPTFRHQMPEVRAQRGHACPLPPYVAPATCAILPSTLAQTHHARAGPTTCPQSHASQARHHWAV